MTQLRRGDSVLLSVAAKQYPASQVVQVCVPLSRTTHTGGRRSLARNGDGESPRMRLGDLVRLTARYPDEVLIDVRPV